MRWILGIVVLVVIAWVVFSTLRRRSDVGHSLSLEERRQLAAEEGRDEALREREGFAGEWVSLIEGSPAARAAYERLQPFGQPALDRLAEQYRQHGDVEQLPKDAERIARDLGEQ